MAYAIILLPLAFAALALLVPSERWRPWLLPMTALCHGALVFWVLWHPTRPALNRWLLLDDLGRIILGLVSVLFLACAFYAVSYLRYAANRPNRIFCGGMLVFLSMMSLVAWSHHLGLLWVAVEATTLASAPLIAFEHTPLSLEATWKYLLVCSVGIALALLGSFFLAYASLYQGLPSSLLLDDLLRVAPALSTPWLHAAFVLILVGYGTKMGLAPMHTWLPDAHGEAPAPVSAMLSGALLPCAFLAILRIYHLCLVAGESAFARRLLIITGLFSMAVTAVFVMRQRDLKRLLAYSSVEQMGLLAIGIGIGGSALFGTLLHTLNNGLTKALLFLSVGNIYHAYGSKSTREVSGVLHALPVTGIFLIAGFFALAGSPPFAPFVSLFTIVHAVCTRGGLFVAGALLVLLLLVFVGMGRTILAAVQGRRPDGIVKGHYRDTLLTNAPMMVLLAVVLMFGIYIPGPVRALLQGAVQFLETQP